ncbi:MAG: pantoate--beta-alanine ligase [Bacteroidaceae bacterium]|nr:pantoate--beta-alanine ligase [Bacteroidaceae bacterium]
MKVFHKIVELQNELFAARKGGKEIGLVPTMGALHAGHASLVKRSVKENNVTVVSVFVNPTQFNDKNDLKNYPRDLEADCNLLESAGADYVFAPAVDEVYPVADNRQFSFPPVDTVMEGAHRPGHFNGVCQVVSRLFYIVRPTRAYFGEKDFQQIAVIKAMVKNLGIGVQIVDCSIVREEDGLALSSRNQLLSPEERKIAVNISKTLKKSLTFAANNSVEATQKFVVDTINAIVGLEVQYYQIVDGNSLQPVQNWDDNSYIVGCITVFCGKTPIRLIDNIKYKELNR